MTHLKGSWLPGGLEVVGVNHKYDLVSIDHTGSTDDLAVKQVDVVPSPSYCQLESKWEK